MPTVERFQQVEFGNYTLVSLLGRGGMAEVYKARSRGAAGFERIVCVKRVLRQHSEDKHFLDMFVNEAKISARLSHPNIVQVYELGEINGEFFMAMEFVHGRDLLRVLRTHADDGPLPPGVAAYIAREMCRALGHAHEHKGDDGQVRPIIHRDVSPQNVMISFDGIVKVVDFGIAKATQMAGTEETRTGALKGKFAYMAPEQLDGQKASPMSDIFAVGVVLHEMLTGRRLFKGNTDYDTLVRVKTQPIPAPSALSSTVPADLDRIVATSLQRDPAQRYQKASQMARDLEQFCGRVGFTSDDMKEFMGRVFPNREEVPDGVASVTTGTGAPSTNTRGTAAQTPASRVQKKGGTGVIVAAVAVGVVAASGAGFYLVKGNALHGAQSPVDPVAALPTTRVPTTPPKAEGTTVLINSTPAGAEVLDGPRLLGTTPLEVKLTEGKKTLALHLSKGGFDDIDYTLTAADAPALTLKLAQKVAHHSSGSGAKRTPTAAAPTDANKTPHVKTFDDADNEAPKVKTIED